LGRTLQISILAGFAKTSSQQALVSAIRISRLETLQGRREQNRNTLVWCKDAGIAGTAVIG
jgi:hypothetical protein